MNRVWTEAELEILQRDRAAKVPIPMTAEKLGRPVPATYAKARAIGTLVQTHRKWDDESVARLRALISAHPPVTDKWIAEELGRTVTQIRWKLQDLGLIGVRDLSALARATAPKGRRLSDEGSSSHERHPPASAELRSQGLPSGAAATARTPLPAPAVIAPAVTAVWRDPVAEIAASLRRLETEFSTRLKDAIAETEAGMVRAAMEAIAAKSSIDQRLAEFGRRVAPSPAATIAEPSTPSREARGTDSVPQREHTPRKSDASGLKDDNPAKRERRPAQNSVKNLAGARKAGTSQPPAVCLNQAPPRLSAPTIVVLETPAVAIASPTKELTPGITSGRGGWKSVRKDSARGMVQGKARAQSAGRADAIDLAHAAQAAIQRFINERGVTKPAETGVQALVSRLQARGYIVVHDGAGWVIDRRQRLNNEFELAAFAEARGIS